MSDVLWKHGASNPVSYMTTELNSLTTTGTATSPAIDNSTNRLRYTDVQLSITYGTNPTAGSLIELYVVRSVDGGTTYEAVPPASGAVGAFQLTATTSLQVLTVPGVLLPPDFFKFHVVAKTTGQTSAASGNTLTGFEYTEEIV